MPPSRLSTISVHRSSLSRLASFVTTRFTRKDYHQLMKPPSIVTRTKTRPNSVRFLGCGLRCGTRVLAEKLHKQHKELFEKANGSRPRSSRACRNGPAGASLADIYTWAKPPSANNSVPVT